MSVLLAKAKIGRIEPPNRMLRTASHEGLADDRGRSSDSQFEFYRGFIQGGIALVITGHLERPNRFPNNQ
jgi:2,4-dienoyl-CoA reductase-like NADH-dependent reductase (Old Yellow Enzyme family)